MTEDFITNYAGKYGYTEDGHLEPFRRTGLLEVEAEASKEARSAEHAETQPPRHPNRQRTGDGRTTATPGEGRRT